MPRSAGLPSPVELGFQPKFKEWYEDQVTAIDKVVLSTKRFVALAMPTGSGKSVTGIAAALLHSEVKRAIYLTSTKGLQDQLADDFAELGLRDVRGQRNYPCNALGPNGALTRYRRGPAGRSQWTPGCDEGPCHSGVRCGEAPQRDTPYLRPNCQYYGAVFDARRAALVSTNYAMYFAMSEFAEGLGDVDLLILDEAHDADKELESFLTIELTAEECTYLGSKWLQGENLQNWKDWASFHRGPLSSKIELLDQQPPADAEGAQERKKLKAVLTKLTRLSDIVPLDWILDTEERYKARFSPMRISKYAEPVLFRGIKHVLLMSATMTRKTTQLLGIPQDQLNFWECPSRFALERRPVISLNTTPAVRVNARMHDDAKHMWMRRIDRLIDARRDCGWKGIIHTVSYQRMKELLARSDHKDIMIVHDTAGTREAIRLFKESDGPRLLVSPSVVTGYDFPDDECRYQIIGKVPIPDMRGIVMKTRGDLDKDYSGYLAMQKLVQACGRGMRGPEDWCETFIVDDSFADWFLGHNRKHAPKWFLDAIIYEDTFPSPLLVEI
jgi:ATP-dependent DNA helicase DinG